MYLTKLSSESLGIKANVFFDFSNHGKIIMTDYIVYVGSANYSEESANNTEFGLISRDRKFIEYINSEVLLDVQTASIPYYEYDYTALLLEANLALSAIYNIKNELYEEVYGLHDDVDGKWYYYIEFEATLTVSTLDRVIEILNESYNVVNDIYNAIEIITDFDEDEMIVVDDICEKLSRLGSEIEKIRNFSTLIELSEFDWNEYINEQLQGEYAMVAYEDNLENCIDSASDEALSIVWDLTHKAEDDVNQLIEKIQQFCEIYSNLIENLQVRKIKKISPEIDNT